MVKFFFGTIHIYEIGITPAILLKRIAEVLYC
jgi:hypothetical protein